MSLGSNKAGFFEDTDNQLYILGDVIDRNHQGGVDILKWIMETPNVELLLGNHEKMLLDSRWMLEDPVPVEVDARRERIRDCWLQHGADPTIAALQRESLAWRRELFAYLQARALWKAVKVQDRAYVLVHGGLGNFRRGKALAQYTDSELLWERPYLTTKYDPDAYTVILGHTPTLLYGRKYQDRMLKANGWWNIDTGAAMSEGHPMLLCLDTGNEYYVADEGM